MSQFTIPRNIYYGYGSISEVTSIPSKKAMIISDPIMVKLGWVEKLKDILIKNKTEVEVFSEVESDPSRNTVAKGLEIMNSFKPDIVIGLGGGSVIDAGKAMWVFYELPDMTWEEAVIPFSLPPLRNKARYVAIPSTSGTGTEVGIGAVITNTDLHPAVKKSIDSYETTPDIAIIDPELCLTVPPEITANTGMDVISHAIEAYVATGANPFSDGLAIKAMQIVFDWLPKAYENGDDRVARENMHIASATAGMAFNNTGLGLIHSLAHQLGAVWGIPHGRANAILMPYVLAYNSVVVPQRYADVSLALGIDGTTVDQLIIRLIEKMFNLLKNIDIPIKLEDLEIDHDEFMSLLEKISNNAMEDACTEENPRTPTKEDIKQIYLSAWKGILPNF